MMKYLNTDLAEEIRLIKRVQNVVRRVQRTNLPDNIKEDISTIDRGLSHIRRETETLLYELDYSPYNFKHPEQVKDKHGIEVLESTTFRRRGTSFEKEMKKDLQGGRHNAKFLEGLDN